MKRLIITSILLSYSLIAICQIEKPEFTKALSKQLHMPKIENLEAMKDYTYRGFYVHKDSVFHFLNGQSYFIRGLYECQNRNGDYVHYAILYNADTAFYQGIEEAVNNLQVAIPELERNKIISRNTIYPRIVGDTFFYAENAKIPIHTKIKLGRGLLENGDFKNIYTSPANWVAIMSAGSTHYEHGSELPTGVNHLGAGWNGYLFDVKGIKEIGNKRRGYRYYLTLGGGNIVNYMCDVSNAIEDGELIIDGYITKNKRQLQQVIIQNQPSKADELKKLFELKQQGVISEDEFNKEKEKLLSK